MRSSRASGRWLVACAFLLGVAAFPLAARAQATLITGLGGAAGFGANVLAIGDDTSSASISLTPYDLAGLCFFGTAQPSVFINMNGNITFGGPVSTFTPVAFPSAPRPMIAAWWADVQTIGTGATNKVYWDIRQIAGLGQMVITWDLVGYYNQKTDKLNTFQIVIRETAAAVGATPADYTVEYRYSQLQWTTGDYVTSGGTNGLGGIAAQAGFDAGDSVHYSQLPGSRTGAVLNLLTTSNVVPAQPGVWRFAFHSCQLACATNADCAGPTPICDATSHTCRACSVNADCSAPTAFCGTTSPNVGRCVQCNVGANCTTGTCTNNACVCTSNASCPSGQSICDTTAPRVCRACNPSTPADCTGTTPVCGGSGNCVQCAPGITGACTTPTLACNPAGSCVQCAPGSTTACTGTTAICEATTYACRGCAIATQSTDCTSGAAPYCNTTNTTCVAGAVALTSPPAGTTATTTSRTPAITGTGIPGQAVNVTAGGAAACSATVAAGGTWTCTSSTLPLGSSTIVASSDGVTSTGTLSVLCTADGNCSTGQVCSGSGLCVTPACRGNAGSGSSADCTLATPVCSNPSTATAACGSCTGGTVYNTTSFLCVAPAVALTTPPAGGSATTTNRQLPLAGTGVPGQTVVVTANGVMTCMGVVASSSAWTCTPTANLPLGSLTIVATSAGATSTGTLFVSCTLDAQCSSGQACNVGTGACATPACRGNAGTASGADCPSGTPVCVNPSTATAACTTCATGQAYSTATSACVVAAVALSYPPDGGTASTTVVRPTFTGTGVPGQSVTLTANGTAVCTTAVLTSGAWSCVPMANLPIASLTIVATSVGVTSAGTLVVQCTIGSQCGDGQVCNSTSGACVTPACLGNSGTASGADCPTATPVCLNPDTSSAVCSTCPMAQVYNSTTSACVAPSIALSSPAAGSTTNTTDLRDPLSGTGVPGQVVTVVANGVTICSTTVVTNGTWTCAPTSDLALGSLTLIATSGGASSSAVLVVQCTLDAQCTLGQVCAVTTGVCVTPSCLGNAGAGSGGACPAGAPICVSPGTSSAACVACGGVQVYDGAAFTCVAPFVGLSSPMEESTTNTTDLLFPFHGTGVAGQPVNVTANGVTICAAIVATDGTWTCTPTTALALGMLAISASSGGATIGATLNVECTLDSQCLTGQVCNTTPGVCIAPACLGNAGTASASDCPGATPVCTGPGTAASSCAACAVGLVYNTTSFACVAPSVTLTSPPANGVAMTTQVRPALTGTGVPGQSVTVTANGMSACTTTVASDGTWSCNPLFDLAVGSQTIVATSGTATSTGTLVVACTLDAQCTGGQACDTTTGSCVTPSCLGSADSGTAGDCPDASPVCSAPNTASAACGTCTAALVYNNASFACVAPAVDLVSPPADSTATTTNLLAPITGTGVPGQTVTVTDNGTSICSVTVAANGTWTCTSSSNLPLGSNTIVATSAGVASSSVLIVACTLDGQCGAGQVCNVLAGVCVTPSCEGNSGASSAADCTPAEPVCTAPGTSSASCDSCAATQVYNTTTLACVSPIVSLTSPPAGGSASSTNTLAPIAGTGVPGQSVSITGNGQSICTTSVGSDGHWTCTPTLDLPVGPLLVTATSGGATSTATLILLCTGTAQCTMGQACDTTSGGCTTPSCRGNAGAGSTADCAASTPVCSTPSTATALCGPCATGQVYDTAGHQCVGPAVALTAPPAGGSANTQLLLPSIAGTGIPGQTVTVSVNGLTICTVTVESDATWSCVPSTNLPLGSNIITANSAGAISSATLVVQCTLDPQCDTGQVCNIATGACTTPNCTDNAGAGTIANCPSATPVCESPGTSGATCTGCAGNQVYDTTAHVCLPGMVVLSTPPAGGSSTTTSTLPALDGIGVPGQSVMVTSGAQTLCVTVVLANGTWTCTSTVVLPPGNNIIVANSAGATSTGTLVEHCTLNVQCASAAPACEVISGLCVGCVVDTGCATGTFCDATHNTCAPALPAGAACTRGVQCAAGVCTQGLCGPGSPDGGVGDGGVGDGGGADVPDSGTHVPTLGGGGCDCTTTGTQAGGGALAGLGLLVLALARRRSRRRSRISGPR